MKQKISYGVAVLFLITVVFLGGITLLEYRPKDTEELTIMGEAPLSELSQEEEYKVTSFNIGYGSLSETQDFFMDGGSMVRPSEKSLVENNLKAIKDEVLQLDSDFVLWQEIDEDSKRSYNINQVKELLEPGMEGSYAYNFKATYVPYPFPPIGKVRSGLMTMGNFKMKDSQRISLPNPFSWPIRTVNLKRALQITRYPVKNSDQEFVLVNFHLEAYDSGEGKREQTKLLSSIIEEEFKKGNYVVAGGDWNQTLLKGWTLEENQETEWEAGELDWSIIPDWEMGIDKETPTNRSLIRPYMENKDKVAKFYIDGFIVSPNIRIVETKVDQMDFKNSDHEPVVMKFILEKE